MTGGPSGYSLPHTEANLLQRGFFGSMFLAERCLALIESGLLMTRHFVQQCDG
jgi:hypothetical protein